ncbi:hypothetical protein [Algibacter mikhailovii]|uniref:hypothetical protein n=1 Tax=Algibacter mikhailovii TaxID=425498 RepID=UPI00249571BF|nr:hypothetical protein [Algibacter mikhailovii]
MKDKFTNSYRNSLNINLKQIHKESNSPSEYHMLNGKPLGIDDLDFVKSPVKFQFDGKSNFKITNENGLNFLSNEDIAFPCSRVYENIHGGRWVNVFLIPDGKEVLIDRNNNSVGYSFYTLKLFEYLNSYKMLIEFDEIYNSTFSSNTWFSESERIQFLCRSSASTSDILKAYIDLQLLNPFQLSIINLLKNKRFHTKDLIYTLSINNAIPTRIPYVTSNSLKLKISESSEKIIQDQDFKRFIESLTSSELECFFEFDYLRDNIDFNNLYDEFLMDLLDIKIIERWMLQNVKGVGVGIFINNKLSKLKINEKLVREYYKRLKKNLRGIENRLRISKGFNIVGSLYSESLLFNLLTKTFPEYTITSQYSPSWLGRQRIDIFIEELKIAIEYNGLQHYQPVAYFGGKIGFEDTIKRDKVKKSKCKKNGIQLIEVRYDEDLYEFIKTFKSYLSK